MVKKKAKIELKMSGTAFVLVILSLVLASAITSWYFEQQTFEKINGIDEVIAYGTDQCMTRGWFPINVAVNVKDQEAMIYCSDTCIIEDDMLTCEETRRFLAKKFDDGIYITNDV